MENDRPSPEALLARLAIEEKRSNRGHLRLFFGMCAGVGKTYQMLTQAHERLKEGVDVWIGLVETHGRVDIEKLMSGLPIIPRKRIEYKGTIQEEMDLDAILNRKPALVLIDELAHTNIPGSRHEKRYQDIMEVLDAGIDVYSTMNVQHLESRADIVGLITAAKVRETVPDTVLDLVDKIDLIDLTPDELIKRLKEGKIYPGRKTEQALQYFFQEGNLSALREMVLRVTANKVERDMKSVSNVEKTEKLLVAVSHSPFSEKLIRTARRVVEELEIGWVAVHVDTGKLLGQEDHERLIKNLEVAKELGAETISLHGAEIAETISDYAAKNKVVQMIVGRPVLKTRWWQRSSHFIEDLIKKNPKVDITVLQQPAIEIPTKRKKRIISFIQGRSLGIALMWVVATAVVNYYLNPFIGYRAVGFLFLMLIVVLGALFPVTTVLLAAISSGLIWNYFFIPPPGTLAINAPEDVMMFLAFIVIAVTSGILTSKIKQNQKILQDREEKTRALYEILMSMTLVRGTKTIIDLVLDKIEGLFSAECCVLLPDSRGLLNLPNFGKLNLSENEKAVATYSFNHGRMAGWSTDTLSLSQVMCVSLKQGENVLGVLAFKPKIDKKLTPDQKSLLISIINQIGVVLARQRSEDDNRDSFLLKESEKLHKTILNCVSHELRTPLTAIMGASSALESQAGGNDNVKLLSSEIIRAAKKLNRTFENLLDVTRLESGTVKLKTEWFDLSELIDSSIRKIKDSLAEHKIQINLPPDAVYLYGDFELLEHTLTNILLNAANYSPVDSIITIHAKCIDDKNVILNVSDMGPGILDEHIVNIFDKFYRVPGTETGGLGLGLSIAKSLVEAHGGTINVRNNIDGGATFSITLPYQVPPKQVTG